MCQSLIYMCQALIFIIYLLLYFLPFQSSTRPATPNYMSSSDEEQHGSGEREQSTLEVKVYLKLQCIFMLDRTACASEKHTDIFMVYGAYHFTYHT